MGAISDLVGALALLGALRAWDVREEEKISRQEEVFVPFNLSSLPQQEQVIDQTTTAGRSPVAVARPVPYIRSTP